MYSGVFILLGWACSAYYMDFSAGNLYQSILAPMSFLIFGAFAGYWCLARVHRTSEINQLISGDGGGSDGGGCGGDGG